MANSEFQKRPSSTEGIYTDIEYLRAFCEQCPRRSASVKESCQNPFYGTMCPEMERLQQALEWQRERVLNGQLFKMLISQAKYNGSISAYERIVAAFYKLGLSNQQPPLDLAFSVLTDVELEDLLLLLQKEFAKRGLDPYKANNFFSDGKD